jgi:predicted nucleic acid-binding protein
VLVVDTNVLAAFLLSANETAAALAVHTKDPQWAAPPLWRSELRSVLVQYVRAGRLEPQAAYEAIDLAAEAIIHEQDVLSHDVLELALASGCSSYDCEFVALANTLASPLVTFDRTLLREFPGVAIPPSSFATA